MPQSSPFSSLLCSCVLLRALVQKLKQRTARRRRHGLSPKLIVARLRSVVHRGHRRATRRLHIQELAWVKVGYVFFVAGLRDVRGAHSNAEGKAQQRK